MQNAVVETRQVTGAVLGSDQTSFPDPVYIFKGKLRAAATRKIFYDSADVRWLKRHFGATIRQHASEYNLEYLGRAMRIYPELELAFQRIGVDISAAKAKIANVGMTSPPVPQPGDVQRGVLG